MSRILTVPVRLSESVPLTQLSGLVAIDAARRWASDAAQTVSVRVATLSGGLSVQHDLERLLAREGLDRQVLGEGSFRERIAEFESAARDRLRAAIDELGCEAEVEGAEIDRPEACRAAVTAFVRLYEAGLVRLEDRVVGSCPRCATVLGLLDIDDGVEPATVAAITLTDGDVEFLVDTAHPELLSGAVAVAVPPGHLGEGREVDVPMADLLPVVTAGHEGDEPWFVIPGHDAASFDLARRLNLAVPVIVDDEGLICAGPFSGFARFAARSAAIEALGDRAVARDGVDSTVKRCASCATELVDRLQRVWTLDLGDHSGAAADVVREGTVTFAPPTARDQYLRAAADLGPWTLSQRLSAGCPVPAAVCVECGQAAVCAHPPDSCGKCMGELLPETAVLDARFVGALDLLSAAGWPDDGGAVARLADESTLVCGPGGIEKWVVPMLALGVALAVGPVVAAVVVHEPPRSAATPGGAEAFAELLTGDADSAVLRVAVLSGDEDLDRARQSVELLLDPPEGEGDIDELAVAVEADFAGANVATALHRLLSGAEAGVPANERGRFRRLVTPLLAVT